MSVKKSLFLFPAVLCGKVGLWGVRLCLGGLLSAAFRSKRAIFPGKRVSFRGLGRKASGENILGRIVDWGEKKKFLPHARRRDAIVMAEALRMDLAPKLPGNRIPVDNRNIDEKTWERIREILNTHAIPWYLV